MQWQRSWILESKIITSDSLGFRSLCFRLLPNHRLTMTESKQEFPFRFVSTYCPCDAAYEEAFDINYKEALDVNMVRSQSQSISSWCI